MALAMEGMTLVAPAPEDDVPFVVCAARRVTPVIVELRLRPVAAEVGSCDAAVRRQGAVAGRVFTEEFFADVAWTWMTVI